MKYLILFTAVALLTGCGCGRSETKCGKVVSKYQKGKWNEYFLVGVRFDDGTYDTMEFKEYRWAMLITGSTVCKTYCISE